MSKLKLVKDRYAVNKEDWEGSEYVTKYENEGYEVFIIEDDNPSANVVRKSFNYPDIYIGFYSGGINIPALGTLKPNELKDYIHNFNVAIDTYEQIVDLINNYWKHNKR